MHLPWVGSLLVHSTTHSWLLMAWTVFWPSLLHGLLPPRVGPCLIVGLALSFSPLFVPSVSLPMFLPCHSIIPIAVLFNPCLLCLFQAYYMDFLQWPSILIGFILMPLWGFFWPIMLVLGSFGPFLPPWASLVYFLPFGILDPLPSLHSHRFLLTLLGFSNPITISFILGVHGLFINPLLSYFITLDLLWSILTFLHCIMPMGLLLISLGSFRPICFSQGPFVLLYVPMTHCSCHSGYMGFPLNPLTLFLPIFFHKMQNEHKFKWSQYQ